MEALRSSQLPRLSPLTRQLSTPISFLLDRITNGLPEK
jgi:hypothetical protein